MNDKKKTIISQKDVLILQKLLEDGRQSSSSISKEINLGREIVNYRIKRLIKENLIVKFIPKINKLAISHQEYIIFLKLNLDDELSREKFIKEQIGNKYLIWTLKSKEGWDLIIRLYTETFEEFKIKLSEILEGFSDVLADYYTIISSDEIKECEKEIITKELFKNINFKKDFSIIKNEEIINIDNKDKEILKLLEEDGRGQYKDISEKLNISSDTVKYRIEKMKHSGLIESIEPVINFNKLGFITYAVILKFKFLSKDEEIKINKYLKELECIARAIKSINSQEYFLNLVFHKGNNIEEFKEKLKDKFKEKIDHIDIFKID